MAKFIVNTREVWIQPIAIDASDKGEAIAKVMDGEGEILENNFEYSDTRSELEWTIEEIK
jgi:hypothetical protein